jgi:hypothetical protein
MATKIGNRYPHQRQNLNTWLHKFDIFGFLGGLSAIVNLVGFEENGVAGTLTLTQPHALAPMRIQGTITGLAANQVFNIQARRSADVSDDCANQGDFMNPHNVSAPI